MQKQIQNLYIRIKELNEHWRNIKMVEILLLLTGMFLI